MMQHFAGPLRSLTTVALVGLMSGCALTGSAPREPEITETVLTPQGARAVLRGGPDSLAESAEEAFRVLDISLTRRSVDDQGGMVEGQAGNERVFVEMSAAGPGHTEINVRVQSPTGERWDRAAARGILEEIRRWQGS